MSRFRQETVTLRFFVRKVRILRTHSLRKCAFYPEGFEVFKSFVCLRLQKNERYDVTDTLAWPPCVSLINMLGK